MSNRTVIIFDESEPYATVSTGNNYFMRRIKELSAQYPDEVHPLMQNDAHCEYVIPLQWLRINPPRKISEEERQRRRERFIRNVLKRTS